MTIRTTAVPILAEDPAAGRKEPQVAKKKDQKKGIFCLETHWWGVKGKTTIEPMLRLLETLAGCNAPYRHYDVGTREEFDFYLKKWRGTTFNDFPILYLSFHGAPGELHVGEGRDKSLSLEDLAERLDGGCRGRVVHLGSCGTVDVHGRELKKFLSRTGALAVCGFRENVNWLESTAFDMLVLGRLQGASFQRTSSIRKFDEELKQSAPGLYRQLGFRTSYID